MVKWLLEKGANSEAQARVRPAMARLALRARPFDDENEPKLRCCISASHCGLTVLPWSSFLVTKALSASALLDVRISNGAGWNERSDVERVGCLREATS